MSSLRNAVKRKAHKERAQPADRKRYGLLEKHKDYVLRARDFHKKEDTLKALKLKASFRNPDEFYFKMQSSGTKAGVHQEATSGGGKKWTQEELALMRSQDRGYILTKLQAERKKVEKLQASLHGLHRPEEAQQGPASGVAATPRKHIVFMDEEEGEDLDEAEGSRRREAEERLQGSQGGEEEQGEGAEGSESGSEDEDKEGEGAEGVPAAAERVGGVGRSSPGSGKGGGDARTDARSSKRVAAAYRELEMRRERVLRLSAVLQHMELQKALAGKGRKRKLTVEGEDAPVYKWAKQRQR